MISGTMNTQQTIVIAAAIFGVLAISILVFAFSGGRPAAPPASTAVKEPFASAATSKLMFHYEKPAPPPASTTCNLDAAPKWATDIMHDLSDVKTALSEQQTKKTMVAQQHLPLRLPVEADKKQRCLSVETVAAVAKKKGLRRQDPTDESLKGKIYCIDDGGDICYRTSDLPKIYTELARGLDKKEYSEQSCLPASMVVPAK